MSPSSTPYKILHTPIQNTYIYNAYYALDVIDILLYNVQPIELILPCENEYIDFS